MSGLRHLRPIQMRQLYRACVAPVGDYASTVWHDPLKDKMHLRTLNTVQREALIRVVSAFKTVATQTLEVEAYIPSTRLRLKQRSQRVVAKLHTLPQEHPVRNVLERAAKRAVAKGTAPRFPLAQAIKVSDITTIQALATIDPRPREPWSEQVEQSPIEARQQWSRHKKDLEANMMEEWKIEWQQSKNGQHLKRLDRDLPSKRVLRLRKGMTRHQTYLFTQLRTGHAWVQANAKLHRLNDDDRCECGARETVTHVLVDCPLLSEPRKELRQKIGDSFNSVATMLGGNITRQGRPTNQSVDRTVLTAVIEFAEKCKRFCSRVPRQ
jgi:hypothetical protein